MLWKLSFSLLPFIIIHPSLIFVLIQQIYAPQILSQFDLSMTCSLCQSTFISRLVSPDALKVSFIALSRPFFTPVRLLFNAQIGSVIEYCSPMSAKLRLLLYLMRFNATPSCWSKTVPWHWIHNHYPIFGWLFHRLFSMATVSFFFLLGLLRQFLYLQLSLSYPFPRLLAVVTMFLSKNVMPLSFNSLFPSIKLWNILTLSAFPLTCNLPL